MSYVDFLVWFILLLALSAISDTWHYGSIFASAHSWVESHKPRWWAELLSCPFCLSHWLAAASLVLYHWAAGTKLRPFDVAIWLSLVKGMSLLRSWLPVDVTYSQEANDERAGGDWPYRDPDDP